MVSSIRERCAPRAGERRRRRAPAPLARSWSPWAIIGLLVPTALVAQLPSVVEVTVRDVATHRPIEDAAITGPGLPSSQRSDANGRVRLRGLPPGNYRLEVVALGYRTAWVDVVAVNGRQVRTTVLLSPSPFDVDGVGIATSPARVPLDALTLSIDDLPAGVRDVATALEQIPGVLVVRRGGPGSAATVQIRGSSSDQVLVLLDGVPLNSALTGEADLSGVDLTALDRIVVLPGARSARYGPRALGGVILLEGGHPSASRATTAVGTGAWGGREATVSSSWVPDNGWTLGGGGSWSEGRGDFVYDVPSFRGGGEARRENAAYRHAAGHLQASWTGRWGRLGLRGHADDIDRGSPGTIAQPSGSGWQGHRRVGVSARIEAGGPARGAALVAGLQRQDAWFADPTPPFAQPYDHRVHVDQNEAAVDVWRRSGPLALSAGADVRTRTVETTDLGTNAPREVNERGTWARAEVRLPAPAGALATLSAAVRVDHHDLVDGLTTSPEAAGQVQIGQAGLRVAYRSGFSPPALADLFFHEGVLVRANPDLGPERVRGEISASFGHTIRVGTATLDGRISAYTADVDGMILWFPDFRFIWSPVNADVSRRGADASVTVGAALWGASLEAGLQGSLSRVRYRGGVLTGQVAHRPERSGDLSVTVDTGPVALATALHHTGPRRAIAGSELNELPSHTVVDASVRIPFALGSRPAELDIAVSNLLDARTALLVDYPTPGRGWSLRLRVTPLPGAGQRP